MPDQLISPHGGALVDLSVGQERADKLKEQSRNWPSWDLTPRQLCDLELLANGGFSPLRGFLGEDDYESVCQRMRLADGALWPMPVNLDVTEEKAAELGPGTSLALRDPEGVMLAALHISELYRPDRQREAKLVFGTTDRAHPGVAYLLDKVNPVYLAGTLDVVAQPVHYDYKSLRPGPRQLRARFEDLGWARVVAFQTRNPMHRAHVELTLRAAKQVEANLLIHPSVGMTKPGDVDHHTRVRCYEAVLKGYPHASATLALLPLAMRMGGPREAVWHAIIRKNFGASHFIVGRDHAGPGNDSAGQPFYGPYDAQALCQEHERELGVGIVPFQQMVYVEERDEYMPVDEVPAGVRTLDISGTELRRRLAEGREIPSWFTFPEVATELRRSYPPRSRQGFTVFFTGLSGAGKSTIASILLTKLLEEGGRPVTLLDGDVVRKHLSSELGFSKEHRDINIRRIGWVASEITKNGGIAICAPIAPYEAVRSEVRSMIEPLGGFILVHVSTPIEVCELRDRKGLYAKARAGIVKEFTGVSDPYEVPDRAEVRIDTSGVSAEAAAQQVVLHLQTEGYLGATS
ncbi:MAG TPA: bifunctional sulfate adenylyltransferase/adenylylsulfate kinase [Acidimicrobiales bacterium]|nr:bifunctional sulfate adenylyltransferase/adenylylsulfate kinase [Acidimicrobiales bacterium]